MEMIAEAVVLLVAAILVVPVFRRLGLGDVLGYLCAGLVVGPFGLRLIGNTEDVLHFAEIGVVFLLFIIGLELQPSRLWVFRKLMFGLGSVQVLVTMACIAVLGRLAGLEWPAAIAIGGALALSSTAFVLQLMGEEKELMLPHGRAAFGVLLFQDIAVVPLLALVAVLSEETGFVFSWQQAGEVLLLLLQLAVVVVLGRYLLQYLMQLVVSFRHRELFTATALLLVIGSAYLFEMIGLSMGLGAFTAGVLMADSTYRHQLEADIIPFKGLLLGLFFIAVGMSANLAVLFSSPWPVAGVTLVLVVGKFLLLLPMGYLFGLRESHPRRLALLLAQGGEFAFVLLTVALADGLIEKHVFDTLVLSVTLSMMCTPLLFKAEAAWRERHEKPEPPEFDPIIDDNPCIFIAGFGRVGQIVGRVLNSRGIKFVALDADPDQVSFVRRFGNKVYFGDATRIDVLRSAHVEGARIFVSAVGDMEASLLIAEHMKREYPKVRIIARARNRQHELALRAIGVDFILRDTLLSSLAMAETTLEGLGFEAEDAKETVEIFRRHDAETLDQQFAVRDDEEALVQMAKESAEQLKFLFEQDRN